MIPIRLDEAVMEIKADWPADIRSTRHIGDFTNWKHPTPIRKRLSGVCAT